MTSTPEKSADQDVRRTHEIVLLAGAWLPRTVWQPVVSALDTLGVRTLVPALPGVDDGTAGATLDDQLLAVLAAVDGADRPLVVGHSAACALAWLVTDRRAEAIAGVALIGGFPPGDGETYFDAFPVVDGVVPFPGWSPFEGPDADDLDAEARSSVVAVAVGVPEGVATAVVRLHDERWYDVPVTMVCPEFDPEQAKAWVASGDVPELAAASTVDYVDIDSGHWPMISRPVELASLLADLARTR